LKVATPFVQSGIESHNAHMGRIMAPTEIGEAKIVEEEKQGILSANLISYSLWAGTFRARKHQRSKFPKSLF
jgi:hypothetical protein